MLCPECGKFVQDGSMFCTACGAQTAPGPNGEWGAPPPPPPEPGMPVPHKRPPRDGSAQAIKIVAIVVVVIVILIAVIGIISLMGLLSLYESNPPVQTVIDMQVPRVDQRQISNVTVWDATLEIDTITPRSGEVWWDNLQVSVQSREGEDLFTYHRPLIDDPRSYDDAANGWVDVQVWYVSMEDSSLVSQGDIIKITGMDERYQGGTIYIREKGSETVILTLPLDFP